MVECWKGLPRKGMEFPSLMIFKPNWSQPWATCSDSILRRGIGLDNLQRSPPGSVIFWFVWILLMVRLRVFALLCFVTSTRELVLSPMDLPLPGCQDHQTGWTAHLGGKHHHQAASLTFIKDKCSRSQKLFGQKIFPEILKHVEAKPGMFLAAGGRRVEIIT